MATIEQRLSNCSIYQLLFFTLVIFGNIIQLMLIKKCQNGFIISQNSNRYAITEAWLIPTVVQDYIEAAYLP